MKLRISIVCLALSHCFYTQTMDQERETKTAHALQQGIEATINANPLSFVPAVIASCTQDRLHEALNRPSRQGDSMYHPRYVATVISSGAPLKFEDGSAKEEISVQDILKRNLRAGEVAIIKFRNNQHVILSDGDKHTLMQRCSPAMIHLIHDLAQLDKGTIRVDFTLPPNDVETFKSLPISMQTNLKNNYPWLPDVLRESQPQHSAPSIQPAQSQSRSLNKWALAAALPIVGIASYLTYKWFFAKK